MSEELTDRLNSVAERRDDEVGSLAAAASRRLVEQQDRIDQLDAELEETNEGMVALTVELQEAEQRYKSLFQNNRDAAVRVEFTDSDVVVREVNGAFEETFGYGLDELREAGLAEVLLPDGALSLETIRSATRNGETLRREVTRRTADGPREFIVRTIPISSSATDSLGVYVVCTDITERKRREQRLEETTRELNRVVEELERSNERLERFAETISHDLRNPLSIAMGRLSVARQEYDDEHLEAVADAHDRMEALISDVLALARQGRSIDETEVVDLAALTRKCWGMVETTDAELVTDGTSRILADPDRLQQLLENLFRNSVEHGSTSPRSQAPEDAVEHGRPEVTVRVGPTEDGFYVADDGPGIPEDERDDVFDSGYTTADDGTGFGLAIVSEVADAHGWDIRVTESAEGGARFEIRDVEFG
jgi:PAS domain S-box-containing protein